jgi:CDP-6-deoxy-D-xylo-4-hexulose-3-dehydrase
LQQYIDANGVDTRTVWTGNATRQPMLKGKKFKQPKEGLPNADAIMERGVVFPMNHSLQDEDIAFVTSRIENFINTL